MKRILFITLLCLSVVSILKAQKIKTFYENKDQGYVLYAGNSELFPVSISLDLDMSNMIFSERDKKVFVIPAKTEKYKIGEVTAAEKGQRYKFSYKFISTIGDVTITKYDKAFPYDLPFQKGTSYKLFQGYNGVFSHKNENAMDFSLPEGSEVLAARDGIVVQVIKNNTQSCAEEECAKYNNYVMVMHADGTFASYVHIKYDGTKLNPGDSVKKGDVIAYSGNVGWSKGPHLHFVCFLGAFGKRNTLETRFRINKGIGAVLLNEGTTYLRDY
ncbi:MAG: M23 family metallopeptidase [Bacteroidota bacterium]